ncbi:protein-S-isoprenylcysteine O-methyltransferase Ste14 [Rhizobium rosettiformans]|uniref:Isoprenylcysteine carboxylmethyltransferase family protein n=2 Tax=Rhizobium rosettiformans TaxID=1368430 RepID=A0A4S8Q3U5_9HYPH|nr:protein-S-isoprenylcysteine O-methyltransferase [Rhizobium rosettiformans]MBB5277060.1 protein-S-isoprenylcysteine O-methyltransferase Ste14 [Rhizobium rosettiformans]THV34864.1 isoprenylcysteine carboxylmethyltransferase family protein [Rhizobium rosettiformans W3]
MTRVSFILWALMLVTWCAMRYPAMRRARRQKTRVDRRSTLDISLLVLCTVGLVVLPILWRLHAFDGFADRGQGIIPLILGLLTGVAFLWLFRRSHKDLGKNWSVTLEVREGHQLVTQGVYAHVRHPMYASFLLWGVTQALLIPNWIAGFAGLAAVLALYAVRQSREEAMMRDTFGAEYDAYSARTKRLIPGIF